MQSKAVYADLLEEVESEFIAALERACDAGIPQERIAIDPGLGFAKTPEHNLLLLQGPQVQAAQALAGQGSQPVARHVVDGGLGLAHIVHAGLRHGLAEGPADELRVQFPAQVKGAQVDQHMGGRRIGRR